VSFNWWDRLPRWAQAVLTGLGSWGTEMLGGLALSLGLCMLARWLFGFPLGAQLFAAAFVGLCASLFYESQLDPNGWSVVDIGQRACGQVLGLLIWAVL
jgi:hypothetical protein